MSVVGERVKRWLWLVKGLRDGCAGERVKRWVGLVKGLRDGQGLGSPGNPSPRNNSSTRSNESPWHVRSCQIRYLHGSPHTHTQDQVKGETKMAAIKASTSGQEMAGRMVNFCRAGGLKHQGQLLQGWRAEAPGSTFAGLEG